MAYIKQSHLKSLILISLADWLSLKYAVSRLGTIVYSYIYISPSLLPSQGIEACTELLKDFGKFAFISNPSFPVKLHYSSPSVFLLIMCKSCFSADAQCEVSDNETIALRKCVSHATFNKRAWVKRILSITLPLMELLGLIHCSCRGSPAQAGHVPYSTGIQKDREPLLSPMCEWTIPPLYQHEGKGVWSRD